ncbi:MAG: type 4a pilus biogenesis protein PilO [Deltaproteobacteria bacterium]|nr:type 4a pilus biogenesis protein PilO [Deltaproteobacteria bacterium]
MKALHSLQSLIHRYESRPLRERILLLVCLLVVLFFLWDTAVMNPLDLRKKRDRKQSNELRIELTELTTRQTLVEAHKDFDPDRENRRKLARLQSEVADIQRQLEANVVNLVSPQEMPELLKDLLTQQQKLQLLSLENLPAEALQINERATEDPLSPVLYRHRLRLEFVGDYLAILAYLNKLEELPRGMVWEKLEIETQVYPQARVRLQVYTLSLNRGWIGG